MAYWQLGPWEQISNQTIFIEKTAFKNFVYKMLGILSDLSD